MEIAIIIVLLIFLICLLPFALTLIGKAIRENDKHFWETMGKNNFPFKWKGKTLWYSRSVATVAFIYCKNKLGEWCVLANKRGKGTPDFQGKWNVPCGYLDFNERAEDCAARECLEETGLVLNPFKFILEGVSTNPQDNHQNVSLRYYQVLEGTIEDHSNFNTDKMEKDEVEDIKWIPILQLDNYEWAFNHRAYIPSVLETVNKQQNGN